MLFNTGLTHLGSEASNQSVDWSNKNIDLSLTIKKRKINKNILISFSQIIIWTPPRLNELTPIIFDMELTHLGSETSITFSTLNIKLDYIKF